MHQKAESDCPHHKRIQLMIIDLRLPSKKVEDNLACQEK